MANADCIWKVKCPLKIRIFMWLTEKDAILTWPELQRANHMCSLQESMRGHYTPCLEIQVFPHNMGCAYELVWFDSI